MKRMLLATMALLILTAALVIPTGAQPVAAATQTQAPVASHVGAHSLGFDKTRFVAHLAVAAFLVHYIYKKYKQGKLGRAHIFTSIKAALAALLAYHEIKKAYDIASTSSSKTLQILVSPIKALTGTLSAMASKLRHGDTSQIPTSETQESLLSSVAGKDGFGYKDQQPAGFSNF